MFFRTAATASVQVFARSVRGKGFDLSNQKALIYITARRQEKQETVCSFKKMGIVLHMELWQEDESPVRLREALTHGGDNERQDIIRDIIPLNVN